MVRCIYRKWNNGKTEIQNYKDRLFKDGITEKERKWKDQRELWKD